MLYAHRWPRIVIAYLAALIFGSVLGSVVQTLLNLMALCKLGVEIDLSTRAATVAQDLVHFGPVYAAIFGLSFAISQALAVLVSNRTGQSWLTTLCALGAACGLWAAVRLVDALAPMPTLIAATRSGFGMLAMAASAAAAGWLFSRLLVRSGVTAGKDAVLPAIALLSFVGFAFPGNAHANEIYQITTVADGLEYPWSVAFLPDGHMLVTERPGRLRLISAAGQLDPKPVQGLPPNILVEGQTGLFDVMPARDFAQTQELFLSYACGSLAANHLCLARARLTKNQGEGSELVDLREIFRTQPAKAGAAHFGGRMAWLPDDTLILTFGDGFDYREQAQILNNHLGSTFRLKRDGSAPADNPFVGQAGIKPEIYSYGHRNVQGLMYDDDRRRLISHEHGPRGGDEINIIQPGGNYGWPIATYGLDYTWERVSPFKEYAGSIQPILHWTPSIAPSGMTLYNGVLFPQWRGSLLVGALVDRSVHRIAFEDGQAVPKESLFGELGYRIRDVKTAPDGAVHLLTDAADGRLLRVTSKSR